MKMLTRSRSDRFIAGICGGLGHYFQVDPTIIRLLMLLILLFSAGTLILIYLIAIFIIPVER